MKFLIIWKFSKIASFYYLNNIEKWKIWIVKIHTMASYGTSTVRANAHLWVVFTNKPQEEVQPTEIGGPINSNSISLDKTRH